MVTLQISNGDYVLSDAGRINRLFEQDALVQRVLFRLCVRRGTFPFLPEMGSQLHRLLREKPTQQKILAKKYAKEALEQEPVSVQDVEIICTEEGKAAVRVYLESQTGSLVVESGIE